MKREIKKLVYMKKVAIAYLILQKNNERISVYNIMRKAGYSRSLFYRDFSSINNIIETCNKYFLEVLFQSIIENARSNKDCLDSYLNLIYDNCDYFTILFKSSYAYQLLDYTCSLFTNDNSLDIYFIFGGIYNATLKWACHGFLLSPNDMSFSLSPLVNVKFDIVNVIKTIEY